MVAAAPWFVPETQGAIGLVGGEAAAVHLRFDEPDVDVLPSDAIGTLNDLNVSGALVIPPVVTAWTGPGREFTAGRGLVAKDALVGGSLATRDVTVEAIVRWNLAAQLAAGVPGSVIVRGIGGSAAEYAAYGVEILAVDAVTGEIRMWWQDVAGVVQTQDGAQFTVGPLASFAYFTATRRWVSPTEVEIRYYAGDQLIGIVASVDGSIGGGTTGTTTVGIKGTGGVFVRAFEGVIDELRVTKAVRSGEEIAASWDRLTHWQPEGYQRTVQLLPPGMKLPRDPLGDMRQMFRLVGQSLGYARAGIENFRRNFFPLRSYGTTLEEWERASGSNPRPADSIEKRRLRIGDRFQATEGSSPPGLRAVISEALALDPADVEIIAGSNRRTDDFTAGAIDENVWRVLAGGGAGVTWAAVGGQLKATAANAVDLQLDGATSARDQLWGTCLSEAQGNGRDHVFFCKIVPTTLPNRCEAGIAFVNEVTKEKITFGIRNDAGTYRIICESWGVGGLSQGSSALAVSALVTHWISLRSYGDDARTPMPIWSTVGPDDPDPHVEFGEGSGGIVMPAEYQYAGLYMRTNGGTTAGAVDVRFDDVINLSPWGDRPFYWYVFRDTGLPGVPDLQRAEQIAATLAQAQTEIHVITAREFTPGDGNTLTGQTPLGAV